MLAIWGIICLLYMLLILAFILGFNSLKDFKWKTTKTKTTFSIVIPFKNEASNIPLLLQSLEALTYPHKLFEVILVDDESTDESVALIETYKKQNTRLQLTVIPNKRYSGSPKKDAIAVGVEKAEYDWIVTTDADCQVPHKWLSVLNAFIQSKNPHMVVMPVTYRITNKFLDKFQYLDFLSLTGCTAGGFGLGLPFMCSGANLAYRKATFNTVNGYEGNNHIAGGDDIFLMEKISKAYKGKVRYLKSVKARVTTLPQPNWGGLLHQRQRWAAKASAYHNPFAKLVATVVFLMNFSLILFTVFSILNIFPGKLVLLGFAVKFNLDFFLMYVTAGFLKQHQKLFSYPLVSLLYPLFVTLTAFKSFFGTYTWKGNTFKK